MWTWITLGVLVVLIAMVGWFGWRLARMRRAGEARAERLSDLRTISERMGIDDLWESSVFQSHVIGMRGELNGFRVRGELWEDPAREAYRLSVRFPKVLRQPMKIRRTGSNGRVLPGRGLVAVSTGDAAFDARFATMVSEAASEKIDALLDANLRERMVALSEKVSSLRLGNRSLYVLADREVETSEIDRLLRETLRVAVLLYNSSVEVGPLTAAKSTQYEQVSLDIFGRDTAREPAIDAQEEGESGESEPEVAAEEMESGEPPEDEGSSSEGESSSRGDRASER